MIKISKLANFHRFQRAAKAVENTQNTKIDVTQYMVKAKDFDCFRDIFLDPFVAQITEKNGEAPKVILENPAYEKYRDQALGIKYNNWAIMNLRNKGYAIQRFYDKQPDENVFVYILNSLKAQNKYDKLTGKNGFLNQLFYTFNAGIDHFKAKTKMEIFSSSVANSDKHDIHYNDAAQILYLEDCNRLSHEEFQKFLKNMKMKSNEVEIEY